MTTAIVIKHPNDAVEISKFLLRLMRTFAIEKSTTEVALLPVGAGVAWFFTVTPRVAV